MSTSAATTPNAIFAQHLRQAMNGVELAPSASTVGASNGTLKALGAMKSPNPGSPVNGQSSKMGKASVNPLKRKASATASSSPAVGAATAAGESPKAPVAPVKLEATARAAEPSHGGRIDGKVWLAQQVDRMEAALKVGLASRGLACFCRLLASALRPAGGRIPTRPRPTIPRRSPATKCAALDTRREDTRRDAGGVLEGVQGVAGDEQEGQDVYGASSRSSLRARDPHAVACFRHPCALRNAAGKHISHPPPCSSPT